MTKDWDTGRIRSRGRVGTSGRAGEIRGDMLGQGKGSSGMKEKINNQHLNTFIQCYRSEENIQKNRKLK